MACAYAALCLLEFVSRDVNRITFAAMLLSILSCTSLTKQNVELAEAIACKREESFSLFVPSLLSTVHY